jgi:hypothetical protein
MSLKAIVTQLVTESDNVTHDLYKYLAIGSIVTGLGLQAYAIIGRGQPFDMQQCGMGVGALFAGVGIALGLKKE